MSIVIANIKIKSNKLYSYKSELLLIKIILIQKKNDDVFGK